MENNIDLNSDTIVDYFYNNLHGLSTIKESDKIYVDTNNIICRDEPYMFQGLWRYYNNIGRNDAVYIITKLFDNIERYYNSIYIKTCIIKNKEKNINMPPKIINEYKLIIEKINNAIEGIKHLQTTYKTDTLINEGLTNILSNIDKIILHFTTLSTKHYID